MAIEPVKVVYCYDRIFEVVLKLRDDLNKHIK
jgi:hypothetical protein